MAYKNELSIVEYINMIYCRNRKALYLAGLSVLLVTAALFLSNAPSRTKAPLPLAGKLNLELSKRSGDNLPIVCGAAEKCASGAGIVSQSVQSSVALRNVASDLGRLGEVGAAVDETAGVASEMLNKFLDAASKNDKSIFSEIPSSTTAACSWCDSFYNQAIVQLHDPGTSHDQRRFLAEALARSGSSGNSAALVDLFNEAVNDPESGISPNIYAKALEKAELTPEVVDQISLDLKSPNPYVREAVISILTRQGTLEATQRLFEHTLEVADEDGYYRSGMGLGRMTPKPEAVDYLEQLASQRDGFSHLAIKALLNLGREGLDRVVKILDGSEDYEGDKKLLYNAVDHINFDNETLAYLRKLKGSGTNPALTELAGQVLREHQIGKDALTREIEYNENFEKGIVF